MFALLDYNYDVLEKLEMDKSCSVTVMATVHDAIHAIQEDLPESNEQVWTRVCHPFGVATFSRHILVFLT